MGHAGLALNFCNKKKPNLFILGWPIFPAKLPEDRNSWGRPQCFAPVFGFLPFHPAGTTVQIGSSRRLKNLSWRKRWLSAGIIL
jgi:hypothetical protein